MSLEKRPNRPPFTNEELLNLSEKFAFWSMNNYDESDKGNRQAQTAASISHALSTLVLARTISGYQIPQGDTPIQTPDVQSAQGTERE